MTSTTASILLRTSSFQSAAPDSLAPSGIQCGARSACKPALAAVLTTIKLYHGPRVYTEEIRNVRSNRMLAPEFEAAELTVAKSLP